MLRSLFGLMLVARLLYPFFNSPLTHLFSDPQRHWDNGERFLHPSLMGSGDPIVYQAWIYAWRLIAHGDAATLCLASGLLCAAMPYGWYRALREIVSRRRALVGALIIGALPETWSLYAYFMNETLLITLLGFCFWMTLRAHRKRTLAAFIAAALLWLAAAFTRTVAVPMAAGCLIWLACRSPARLHKAAIGLALAMLIAIPAGLHARIKLGFFAPFGNLYFNEIYSVSGRHDITADFGAEGSYQFGCPSFYNPTFAPFSGWTTARTGIVSIVVDLSRGRRDWIETKAEAARRSTFPAWRSRWENALYLLFGQEWPISDRATVMGWLTFWCRWIWPPVIVAVAYAAGRRRFRGPAWLLPVCGLGTLLLLLAQSESVMEARYREPIDAILIGALVALP
ncbi:MAG TPA: glycosyltransferase family 39 protein [Steroidobacteraceae bacterium]|nr:glycosyltransferase family 39 protein [Steroidobacteraceae bacterium]